jgi:hypothetical protein
MVSITVAGRSEAVFARMDVEVVGSNPTPDMDVCVCFYSLYVVLCVAASVV